MRRLTITFDNGPDPECTPGVLDALGERGLPATFFVCGRGNRLHPACRAGGDAERAILERARSEGHWIGNHSLTHTLELGTTRDEARIEREIIGCDEILGDLNEHRLFRPYMAGGQRTKRIFSPEAVDHLCRNGYTTVLFNCLPRDWAEPETWPEEALRQMEALDWACLIVHDVSRYGSMQHFARFLDEVARRDVEVVQEFPGDCVPIRKGELVGSLDGIVCGEKAEVPHPVSAASVEHVHP
ncbi:MAG: polysaccharide deacetylase family protein [Myxococcota bacterium]|nr:polysaccharide deacetylase family protein [Myxococcota bacterium]